jgi:hypothetical protein
VPRRHLLTIFSQTSSQIRPAAYSHSCHTPPIYVLSRPMMVPTRIHPRSYARMPKCTFSHHSTHTSYRWPGALVTLTWAEAPESFEIVPQDPTSPPPPPLLRTVERPNGRALWSRAGETDFNTHYTNDPYANAAGATLHSGTAHPPPPPRHTSSVWGAELMGLQRTAAVGEAGGAHLWKFPEKCNRRLPPRTCGLRVGHGVGLLQHAQTPTCAAGSMATLHPPSLPPGCDTHLSHYAHVCILLLHASSHYASSHYPIVLTTPLRGTAPHRVFTIIMFTTTVAHRAVHTRAYV